MPVGGESVGVFVGAFDIALGALEPLPLPLPSLLPDGALGALVLLPLLLPDGALGALVLLPDADGALVLLPDGICGALVDEVLGATVGTLAVTVEGLLVSIPHIFAMKMRLSLSLSGQHTVLFDTKRITRPMSTAHS